MTAKRRRKKGDTWCTAWFLSDGGKRRDAVPETNRPASVRLYIFRRSSQAPFDEESLPFLFCTRAANSPPLATLFFCRYPWCRYFKEGVAIRMRPRVDRGLCARGQTLKTGDVIPRESQTRVMHPCEFRVKISPVRVEMILRRFLKKRLRCSISLWIINNNNIAKQVKIRSTKSSD